MIDTTVKNIIVCIHGIEARGLGWIRVLRTHLDYDKRLENWLFQNEGYGYLKWINCIFPWVRHIRIKTFMRQLRKLQKKYPAASINIIAHSYGTMIAYEAIRRSKEDTKKASIYVNKLILIASVVSAHEDFDDTIGWGLLKEVHNFCSYKDRVAQLNPFGHSGYWGFLPPGKRDHIRRPWMHVYNHRFEVEHSEWFDFKPPNFYRMWQDILSEKT